MSAHVDSGTAPGASRGSAKGSARSGHWWAVAALLWAAVISVIWLVVPAGQSTSITVGSDGTEVVESSRETLLEGEGMSVVALLAVPVLITAVAVIASRSRHARRLRFIAGGVLLAGCMLGAASIGLPYVPAAVGVLLAGAATPLERIAA